MPSSTPRRARSILRILPDQEVFTPAEVARFFRVDSETVARWARAARIASFATPGGHRRYRREELARMITAHYTPTAAAATKPRPGRRDGAPGSTEDGAGPR